MKKEILLLTSLTVLAVILFFVLPISNESVTDSDVDEILTENITDESLIEDGKITKTVKNPNYRAISTPFWNSLKKVGNMDTFGVYGTPYCGKGEPNQSVRVGHAAPICVFDNIDVFGGA